MGHYGGAILIGGDSTLSIGMVDISSTGLSCFLGIVGMGIYLAPLRSSLVAYAAINDNC